MGGRTRGLSTGRIVREVKKGLRGAASGESPIEQAVLVPVMRLWRSIGRSAHTFGPMPREILSVHTRGADSDRVLLVGSGVAAGWGVLGHDIALAGNLARSLSARTGRGTDVDIVADSSMSVHDAADRLA